MTPNGAAGRPWRNPVSTRPEEIQRRCQEEASDPGATDRAAGKQCRAAEAEERLGRRKTTDPTEGPRPCGREAQNQDHAACRNREMSCHAGTPRVRLRCRRHCARYLRTQSTMARS